MTDRSQQFSESLAHFAMILGLLAIGAALGGTLAAWQAPGSTPAMVASVLLFPAAIVAGWALMFPLALLMLPLMIPRFVRWLRTPIEARPTPPPKPERPAKPHPVGWLFMATALPLALIAGLFAGAPFTYLLAGLLWGELLRRSTVLLEVQVE